MGFRVFRIIPLYTDQSHCLAAFGARRHPIYCFGAGVVVGVFDGRLRSGRTGLRAAGRSLLAVVCVPPEFI